MDSDDDDFDESVSSISSISTLSNDESAEEEPTVPNAPEPNGERRELSLGEKLAAWHVEFKENQNSTDALLKILQLYHPELPGCARALVQTPRSVEIVDMDPGQYHHRGLEAGVRQALDPFGVQDVADHLQIYVGIDGVSLTKSSTSQFWPIVGFIPSLPSSELFEIGVYWGLSKPKCSNQFLRPLIKKPFIFSNSE